MPRARNGVARLRKKRRLMRRVKGFEGNRSKLLRMAKETRLRADVFATKHRRRRKGNMRRLWILRINAACRSRGLKYSVFMNALKRAGVSLDRKVISDMAINDAMGFDRLASMAGAAMSGAANN
jgi:large subunit ribosomal protein L20